MLTSPDSAVRGDRSRSSSSDQQRPMCREWPRIDLCTTLAAIRRKQKRSLFWPIITMGRIQGRKRKLSHDFCISIREKDSSNGGLIELSSQITPGMLLQRRSEYTSIALYVDVLLCSDRSCAHLYDNYSSKLRRCNCTDAWLPKLCISEL